MASIEDHLLDWLRDAHAMEQQAEQMLTGMTQRIENYPQLKGRSNATSLRPASTLG